MLKDLLDILQGGLTLEVNKFGQPVDHDIQTMAAVFLVYVARSDHEMTPTDQREVMGALARQFKLPDHDTHHIISVADFLCRDTFKLEEFGGVLSEIFTKGQRVTLLSMIWRVIQADQVVSHLEVEALEAILPLLRLEKSDLMQAIELYEKNVV
jgi:uncharacterized tellurite resistance protein B-like protein